MHLALPFGTSESTQSPTSSLLHVSHSKIRGPPFTGRHEMCDLYSGSWWPMAALKGFQLGVAGDVLAYCTTSALPCLALRLFPCPYKVNIIIPVLEMKKLRLYKI